MNRRRIIQPLILSLLSIGLLNAKSEIVRVTISGRGLAMPIEITDKSVLGTFNIWSGPGNFRIENGVRIPIMQDGSISWSQGVVSEPRRELPEYQVSFYGTERVMYVLTYRYDSTAHQGYAYLPGRGEKSYEVNVRTIYRGVEGHWFRTAEAFDVILESAIRSARIP